MAIVNVSKPSSSIANQTRINTGETWATISTTWASETRAWYITASLVANTAKPSFGYLWGVLSYPWLESSPWDNVYSGMTNINKP